MHPYPYSYAVEKFNRAIYVLSTGEGDVRKRLYAIFTDDLLTITNSHLPEKLRANFTWVKKQLSKYDEVEDGYNEIFKTDDGRLDHYLPTTLKATCQRMKNRTGAKIAQKVFHIWQVLDEESRV